MMYSTFSYGTVRLVEDDARFYAEINIIASVVAAVLHHVERPAAVVPHE